MKMYKILSIIAIVSLAFVGCDEIDNQFPQDQLTTDNFFSSESDFNAALNGAFAELFNYYFDELTEIGDIPTDNVIITQRGRNSNAVLFNFNYNSQNDIGLLDVAYEAVNVSNLIIANLDVLPDGAVKDNFEGQARAIRALAHFDMARVYGPIPSSGATANDGLGVQYRTFEDGDASDPFAQPSRETIGSNYTEILADLTAATTLVDASGTVVDNRFTVEAVYALIARVQLYNGNYQAALDAAANVTTPIVARGNLGAVFQDATNEGVVLKLGQDQVLDGLSPGVIWSQGDLAEIIPEYAIDFEFYSTWALEDIRRTAYVAPATDDAGAPYNAIITYFGETGQVNGQVDVKIIRAAEVALIEAEANFRLGNETEALAALNSLRAQRYSPFTAGTETGTALEDAIAFERRVELFTQQSRFFDLKRLGLAVDRSAFGDFSDGSGTPPQEDGIPANSFRFNYPIPQTELQANPNFTQNPGY